MKKIILLLCIPVFLGLCACKNPTSDEKIKVSVTSGFNLTTDVWFIDKNTNKKLSEIAVEVAEGDFGIEKGLMNRNFMPDSVGMIFIFEDEAPRFFWMKNTMIALDIIYANEKKEIVSIKENNQPYTLESIPSDLPAKYVIEVNAGYCARNNIRAGHFIEYAKK